MESWKVPYEEENNSGIANEGQQTGVVRSVEPMISSKGNPMFLFKIKVGGSLLYHYCLNVQGKRWMLRKTLSAITGQDYGKGDINFTPDDVCGKNINVIIGHETYNGQARAKIKDVIVPMLHAEGQTTVEDFGSELPF